MEDLIITTINSVEGYKIEEYIGVVNANFVAGTDFITDFIASVSDFWGGNSGAYKSELDKLYENVMRAITAKAKNKGADAIVGYNIDFDEISGKGKSMFMISVSGTAVRLTELREKSKWAYLNRDMTSTKSYTT